MNCGPAEVDVIPTSKDRTQRTSDHSDQTEKINQKEKIDPTDPQSRSQYTGDAITDTGGMIIP